MKKKYIEFKNGIVKMDTSFGQAMTLLPTKTLDEQRVKFLKCLPKKVEVKDFGNYYKIGFYDCLEKTKNNLRKLDIIKELEK